MFAVSRGSTLISVVPLSDVICTWKNYLYIHWGRVRSHTKKNFFRVLLVCKLATCSSVLLTWEQRRLLRGRLFKVFWLTRYSGRIFYQVRVDSWRNQAEPSCSWISVRGHDWQRLSRTANSKQWLVKPIHITLRCQQKQNISALVHGQFVGYCRRQLPWSSACALHESFTFALRTGVLENFFRIPKKYWKKAWPAGPRGKMTTELVFCLQASKLGATGLGNDTQQQQAVFSQQVWDDL